MIPSTRQPYLPLLIIVFGVLCLSVPTAAAPDRRGELQSARRQARDADLRADWPRLVDARERFSRLGDDTELRPLVHYYLGYVDWRLSSLAYVVTGMPSQVALLSRAVEELQRAVALQPALADAQALLATCAGILGYLDRTRGEAMQAIAKSGWAAALEQSGDNPRVLLLRAMTDFFVPPQFGGSQERGLERWQAAIRVFEREQRTRTASPGPDWGHAEAWAWLGGAYLSIDRHADAIAALQRALTLRPDFWWARMALAQARTPQPPVSPRPARNGGAALGSRGFQPSGFDAPHASLLDGRRVGAHTETIVVIADSRSRGPAAGRSYSLR